MTAAHFKRYPVVLAPIVRPDGAQVGAHFSAQLRDLLNAIRATAQAWSVPSSTLQDLILATNQAQEDDVPFAELLRIMTELNEANAAENQVVFNDAIGEDGVPPSHPPSLAGLHRFVRAQLKDISILVQVSPGSLAFQIPEDDLKGLLQAGPTVSFLDLLESMIAANDARRGSDMPWKHHIKPVPEHPEDFFITQSTLDEVTEETKPNLAALVTSAKPKPTPPAAKPEPVAKPDPAAVDFKPDTTANAPANAVSEASSAPVSARSDTESLVFEVHIDPTITAENDEGIAQVKLALTIGAAHRRSEVA